MCILTYVSKRASTIDEKRLRVLRRESLLGRRTIDDQATLHTSISIRLSISMSSSSATAQSIVRHKSQATGLGEIQERSLPTTARETIRLLHIIQQHSPYTCREYEPSLRTSSRDTLTKQHRKIGEKRNRPAIGIDRRENEKATLMLQRHNVPPTTAFEHTFAHLIERSRTEVKASQERGKANARLSSTRRRHL